MALRREDFIFTIGYQGDTALVDGSAKRQYGKLSTRELADRGMLKPALCSALYSDDQKEIDEVLEVYRTRSGAASVTLDQLKRTLGVFAMPQGISRVKVL